MRCELCGHGFSQKHRLLPGSWGGTYEPGNVVRLCPNHHTAIHFLMRWYYVGADPKRGARRLIEYADDRPLWVFWLDRVRPIVQARMEEECRWQPHYQPPFPYPSANGEQRKEWLARNRNHIEDSDRRNRVDFDADYAMIVFGDRLRTMTPQDLRHHPLFGRMDTERFAGVVGFLLGRGFFALDGYPSCVMPLR